jgi:hypothetical protein
MKPNTFTTGEKFDRWEIINDSHTTQYFGKNNRPVRCYLCKCDCGKEKLVRGDYLLQGTSKSCGCLRSDRAKQVGIKQKTKTSYHNLIYGDSKRSSKYRNKNWNLTKEQHYDIICKPCFYCSKEPIIRESRVGIPFPHWGIDRQDNTKGYVYENCVSCCPICNSMKMDLEITDFIQHIKQIILNYRENCPECEDAPSITME